MELSHLELLKHWHQCAGKPIDTDEAGLNDMDIIQFQALLMDNGADLFRAFKQGDMAVILSGLVNLSYTAMSAVVLSGGQGDIFSTTVDWRHDGLIISIIRSLSKQIAACASGQAEDYAALYVLCKKLARDFLNADFDKSFQRVHQAKMQDRHFPATRHISMPDLSDCLFE